MTTVKQEPKTEVRFSGLGKLELDGKVPFIVRFAELDTTVPPVVASITSKTTDPSATYTGKARDDTEG